MLDSSGQPDRYYRGSSLFMVRPIYLSIGFSRVQQAMRLHIRIVDSVMMTMISD